MEYILKGVQEEKIKSDTVYRIVEQMNRELISNYTKDTAGFSIFCWTRTIIPSLSIARRAKGAQASYRHLCLPPLEWTKTSSWKTTASATTTSTSRRPPDTPTSFRHASQEAITTLFSAREDFLNAAIEEMERRYGDTDTYLQRGIGLTKEERKRLQDILLTDN